MSYREDKFSAKCSVICKILHKSMKCESVKQPKKITFPSSVSQKMKRKFWFDKLTIFVVLDKWFS